MVSTIYTDCAHCGATFAQPDDPGRKRRFCSGACRTGAYRARKRRQEQAEQQRQRERDERARRRYEEDARRRDQEEQDRWQREDQERHRRQRAQAHQPPPHAGTSRPRVFCGACGGLRAAHTYHHDDAAHERARRRYEGLRAKAASTSSAPRPPRAPPRPTSSATSTACNQEASSTEGVTFPSVLLALLACRLTDGSSRPSLWPRDQWIITRSARLRRSVS